MTEIQILLAIYELIKSKGVLDKVDGPRMGGSWSADTYRLNGDVAMLADDGCSNIIKRGEFTANTTYGRPVEYFGSGNKTDLIAIYNQLIGTFKENDVIPEISMTSMTPMLLATPNLLISKRPGMGFLNYLNTVLPQALTVQVDDLSSLQYDDIFDALIAVPATSTLILDVNVLNPKVSDEVADLLLAHISGGGRIIMVVNGTATMFDFLYLRFALFTIVVE